MWNAIDFSEDRSQEMFAIRFKTAEIANDFRDKFVQGQNENVSLGRCRLLGYDTRISYYRRIGFSA